MQRLFLTRARKHAAGAIFLSHVVSRQWCVHLISKHPSRALTLPLKSSRVGCVGGLRYPSLIKYSVTDSKQLVVDNAFVVKATLETSGDPVTVAPRFCTGFQ